jgi:hypothetical protein
MVWIPIWRNEFSLTYLTNRRQNRLPTSTIPSITPVWMPWDRRTYSLQSPSPEMKVHLYPSIYLWLYSPLLDLGFCFSFLILYTVSRTPWTEDQPDARPLPAHRTAQTQNKRTETSVPQVGFKPAITGFERAKTVHALYRAATVIGIYVLHRYLTYIVFLTLTIRHINCSRGKISITCVETINISPSGTDPMTLATEISHRCTWRFVSSEIERPAFRWKPIDVSKEHVPSIFRVEE